MINHCINLSRGSARAAAAALIVAATQPTVSAAFVGADIWALMGQMPTPRISHQTDVVNGKIYDIGGLDTLQKVGEYDPATYSWTEKAEMPTGRALFASAAVNGKIYVMGGTDFLNSSSPNASVEEYDPGEGRRGPHSSMDSTEAVGRHQPPRFPDSNWPDFSSSPEHSSTVCSLLINTLLEIGTIRNHPE